MISYSAFLVISGLTFIAAERLWPRGPQSIARRGFATDLFYLFMNAEVVGALVSIWLAGWMPLHALQGLRIESVAKLMPDTVQTITLLVTKDFVQW